MKTYFKIFAIVLALFTLSGVICYFFPVVTETLAAEPVEAVTDDGSMEGLFKAENGTIRFTKDKEVEFDIFGIEGTYDYYYNDGAFFIHLGSSTGYLYYDDTADIIQFAGVNYFRAEEK